MLEEGDYPENSHVVFCHNKYVLFNLSCVSLEKQSVNVTPHQHLNGACSYVCDAR